MTPNSPIETGAQPAAPLAAAVPKPPPLSSNGEAMVQTLLKSGLAWERNDFVVKGYHVSVSIAPDAVVGSAEVMDRAGFMIDTITGVDWLAAGEFEVVYDYLHPTAEVRAAIRTRIPRATPELPTISRIFPGANWHERETHDFFGIKFAGHPDLTPLLLPEDADYHPLRKDFAQ